MGTITRSGNEPFGRGETSNGADLEFDMNACFTEINGLVSNANVSASADINGAKLLDGTITEATIDGSNLITPAKQATRAYVATDNTADTATTSTTLVDVPSIANITVTPYTTNDVLLVRFMASIASSGSTANWYWAFEVDGTDTNVIATAPFQVSPQAITVCYQWVISPSAVAPITIKPRYANKTGTGTFATSVTPAGTGGAETALEANKVFTALVLPG